MIRASTSSKQGYILQHKDVRSSISCLKSALSLQTTVRTNPNVTTLSSIQKKSDSSDFVFTKSHACSQCSEDGQPDTLYSYGHARSSSHPPLPILTSPNAQEPHPPTPPPTPPPSPRKHSPTTETRTLAITRTCRSPLPYVHYVT